MRMRSRQKSRGKENEVQRRWGYREGSETKNLDEVSWQDVVQVDGERRREEEGKEAQLTRDFKQKTKVEKQRQNRIEIMTYRRIRPDSKDEACTRAGEGTGVSRVKERRGRGTLNVSCLSFKMHTMAVPSLDFGRAARPPRVGPPTCHPFQLQPRAGEPYASVSQQRPPIPALLSERDTTSHPVSRTARLGA